MRASAVPLVLVAAILTIPWLVRADSSESPLDSAAQRARTPATARLEALRTGDLGTRLRAIRSAPFDHAPEAALADLAEIASGRDPTLAPAAAVAAYRIANELGRAELDAHESDPARITDAKRTFEALSHDATARPDVRRLAGYVASVLASL